MFASEVQMVAFLKVVSGVYLVFVWLAFFIAVSTPTPLNASLGSNGAHVLTFMIAVGLSIPAVALFAFGQVVGDIRIIRNQAQMQSDRLRAMRSYYEPNR
jgi:hypothetical protein